MSIISTLSSIRWGARVDRDVAGGTTVEVAQFLDLKLLGPQQLALALYAMTIPPLGGQSVQWSLQLGAGSFSHIERFTVAVSDELAQVPLVLLRPASTVQVTANIIRTGAGAPKRIRLVAFIAPTSPTWATDVTCQVPVAAGRHP